MVTLELEILKPGLGLCLQDQGRPGWQHLGIPLGGAADRNSALLANWLVGNSDSEPVLEMPLIGPRLKFNQSAIVAITGANMSPMLNDKDINTHTSIWVNAGDILSFGKVRYGCRAYLAIAGHWIVPKWLGSCSKALGIDIVERNFKRNDKLYIERLDNDISEKRVIRPKLNFSEILSFYKGPEWEYLSQPVQSKIVHEQFTIDTDSNRMGCRLNPRIDMDSYRRIISSAVLPGTIQLTPSGQLIILMADAQTVGGYPRIGLVSMNSLNTLAQLKPGDVLALKL